MYGQPWTMYAPQMYPNVGGAQVAPQGFFGNLLGHLAGPAGQGMGGLFGQPQIGGQLGQALGSLGHLLPFQAVPPQVPWGGQPQFGGQFGPQLAWGGQFGYPGGQLTPQGFFGNLLGQFAGPAGQAIGGWFGQPQVGGQLGQALGSLGHLLPFQAVPMPIQQGFPGDRRRISAALCPIRACQCQYSRGFLAASYRRISAALCPIRAYQ